jgi:hypothetical protein
VELVQSDPLGRRLVARRCPAAVAAERRRRPYADGKRRGHPPSAEPLVLCDGQVMVTNLPADEYDFEALWSRYRCRWQVETAQANYPSRRRWVGTARIGYHRRNGVARVGRVVPATPRSLPRSRSMSDTPRTSTPPQGNRMNNSPGIPGSGRGSGPEIYLKNDPKNGETLEFLANLNAIALTPLRP